MVVATIFTTRKGDGVKICKVTWCTVSMASGCLAHSSSSLLYAGSGGTILLCRARSMTPHQNMRQLHAVAYMLAHAV